MFHLPLRALQGFAQSLRDLAFADLPIPNYTTVCRRAQTLLVKLPVARSREPLHLVIDSTGVKVYGEVLPELLDQIPADEPVDTVGGDGAYDTQACYAAITARGAVPLIAPREGAAHWPPTTSGGAQRNEAIDAIEQGSRREWKQQSGYRRRSLAENAMYRFKTLTGPCLWARSTDTQATEVAVRVGVLNRMAELARPQSVRLV